MKAPLYNKPCFVYFTALVIFMTQGVVFADDPNATIANQIHSADPYIDELENDLTGVAESMARTNWDTEDDRRKVGNDLTIIAARFSTVRNTNTLFSLVNGYLLVAPPAPPATAKAGVSFQVDLKQLETDLGSPSLQLPQQPTPVQMPAITRILDQSTEHWQKLSDDISRTNLNALARHVYDFGYDITTLSIQETLWPQSRRTKEFVEVSRELSLKNSSSNTWIMANLWTGAKLLNSYTISGQGGSGNSPSTYGIIQPNSSSTDPYLELSLSDRYILRSGNDNNERLIPMRGDEGNIDYEDGIPRLICPLEQMPEFESKFGYIFSNGTAPTNYNASTIVGSSDIYADTSVGIPFFRYTSRGRLNLKQQLTIEAAGGFSTDRQHLDMHPTAFVGLGYQASFPCTTISTNANPGYWIGKVGYSWIDQPALGSTNSVVFNSLGDPKYNFRGAVTTSLEVVIPVNSSISLQASFNAYLTPHPPQNWNITLGATFDLGKITSAVASAVGLTQ